MKSILNFFDQLEDGIRRTLSRVPIVYAFVAGVGMVLFWRGVWETADMFGLTPPLSLLIGFLVLLGTGVLVAEFLGNRIIITGLRGEKKIEEKTLQEIEREEGFLGELKIKVDRIEATLEELVMRDR